MNWLKKTCQSNPLFQIGQEVQAVLGAPDGFHTAITGTVIDIENMNDQYLYTIEITKGLVYDDYRTQRWQRLWGVYDGNKVKLHEGRLN
ncbi:MAG: hypothetical protein ACXAC5_02480 [Promethearchaeota archaeon]|jgi:hypothetical protein